MTDKQTMYDALVKKRKEFKFQDQELTNPVDTPYDGQYVEPWAQWQGNLDADIVLVGQEFCDAETFRRVQGTVELVPERYEFPTNKGLAEYFTYLNIELGHPLDSSRAHQMFFTNAVMALKPGPMSSNFQDKWMEQSRIEFLAPLLDIIKPKVIITVGAKPTMTIGKVYGFPVGSQFDMVNAAPIRTSAGPLVFPVYHTGGLGLVNRPKLQQIEDWKRIKAWL